MTALVRRAAWAALAGWMAWWPGAAAAADIPYPPFFESAESFRVAIATAEREHAARKLALPARITGVTVPHHLLAADMIAVTLRFAAGASYDRIVLLSPEHFRRCPAPCATTTRPFQTPLGEVAVDAGAARQLCDPPGSSPPLVSMSNLFSHEHGVQAVLPFLAHWFPNVPVLPLALDARSSPADWERLAQRLRALITPRTLIVQSTDFSHYLSQPVAAVRDQETLAVLSSGDAAGVIALDQPAHLDSKAAQWLQMTLQRRVFGCGAPVIVDNRNAIRYGGRITEPRTTSYITQLFTPDPVPAAALPGEAWFFGGDTHFGRYVAEAFADAARAAAARKTILGVTSGRPLILNLEGVILERPSGYEHPMRIGMDAGLTLRELQSWRVAAVSIANNHALDYGTEARQRMAEMLGKHGIAAADEGLPLELGRFRLGVATDVANRPAPARNLLTGNSFDPWRWENGPAKPLFALIHAGTEYASAPAEREREIASWAERAGASLILGAHPHRPSAGWERTGRSLRFHSLGNLLFDQLDPANGGVLVEVRFFEQGTWAARPHRIGNLYRALRHGANR